MDEMNLILPPSLDNALNEIYCTQQADLAFASQLETQLRQHHSELVSPRQKAEFSAVEKRRSFRHMLRVHPILAILIAILTLLALTGMAYALGRLTGFIPGFGFTSGGSPVYVLSEPVEETNGGITLHVVKAVNDKEGFWVELAANCLTEQKDFSLVYVIMPTGEKILFQTSGSSDATEGGMMLSYLFPPIEGQLQELILVVQSLGGQDFSLPLRLRPVEAGEIVPVSPEWSTPLQSESHDGVRLVLDHVAVDNLQTVFQVSLRFDKPNTWLAAPWNITLKDAAGSIYPLSDVTPATMTDGNTHVYQTVPFSGREQLALTLVTFPILDTLPVFVDFSGDTSNFMFDLGTDPKTGQRWELNKVLSAGGFDLKVVSVTLTDEPSLVFEVEPIPGVTGVMFNSPDALVTGANGGNLLPNGKITASMTLSRIPDKPFEVQLIRIYYQAKGTWQIHWRPPAAPTAATEIPISTATPTLTSLPTPTLPASNPILKEAQLLAEKFDTYLQQGQGWVHIVKETTSNPQTGQVFPPPYLKTEEWFEVNAEGYVISSVHTDYNDIGQIIQQAATVGDYSVNFTTGDSGFNNAPHYRISLDILTDFLSRHAQVGGSDLSRDQTSCDDERICLLITGEETFSPTRNPGETQVLYGAGERVWIDLETGQLVKRQTFWLVEDGSEAISSATIYTLVEKVKSPPQEILDILERVIIP
jgi:hypothetical protein